MGLYLIANLPHPAKSGNSPQGLFGDPKKTYLGVDFARDGE